MPPPQPPSPGSPQPPNPPHQQPQPQPQPQGQRRRSPLTGWQIVGIVLASVLAVVGLVVVAGGILFAVAMNQWASNK